MKTEKSQILRWLNDLSNFNFSVEHRKGERMTHVDALSRSPVEAVNDNLEPGIIYNVCVREDGISMYQHTVLRSKYHIL